MSILSRWRACSRNTASRSSVFSRRFHPALEALEDRFVPANFTVTRSADDLAAGSLRRAITDANATTGPDTISFNIPGSGVQTINLTADLPAITEAVTIDGYTQPGASANTLAVGNNATLLIELNGTAATDGLVITATGSIIRGLIINRFSNDGIKLDGTGAISNVIEGNFIGVDATGSTALPNLGDGINVRQASGNTIGGTTPESRNVISGNGVRGILIRANSTGNVVQGNYIGTDAAGVNAVGNATSGIRIADGSDGNIVGGTISAALNLISGNGNHGVLINDAANNLVQGNLIGTDAAGAPSLGNQQSGVLIENGSTNNSVGGTQLGAGNVIAFNSNGVTVAADSVGNPIQGNRIVGNNFRGIDLGDDGFTPNDLGDADSGANNRQNFPVLFSAEAGGGVTVVSGSLNSTPDTEFSLEFFHNDNPGSEGTAQGDVRVIPTTTPTVVTDEFGNVSFSFTFTENLFGRFITATATRTSDPRDTSEISDPVECVEAASFVVSTTLDVVAADGLTSLREAMLLANSSFGLDTIGFNIPGSGVQTITLSSQLPTITQSVVIDGYTQPGASANTLAVGNDAVLLVELNGNDAVSTGLTLASFFSTIRGLVINRFTQSGIVLDGFAGAEGNAIVGNFIGTDPTGTLDRGNGGDGIRLDAGSFGFARNNFIGGPAPQARNVISGNGSQGIEIFATGAAAGTTIENNYIGTNAAGTLGLGNSGGGVAVLFEDATRIENNLISGNTGFGVELFGSVEGTLIRGNRIGTDAAGTSSLGNSGNGVSMDDSAANNNTTVGNTIAFNGGNGVSLTTTGSGNSVRGNAIHTNGGLGINLGADAVTPNDTGDADSGPNNLQNFPELLSVFSSGGDTTLVGALHSTPNTTFELDFFRNAAADLSGFGEGEILLAFSTTPRVTTDANGDVLFTFSFSGDFLGQFFSATATRVDAPFDTSEFSAAVRAAAAPSFVVDTTADTLAADGVTSLREAILLANALPGLNTITFNIPGSGVQTIALTAALPTISDAVVIDGYSQPGASPNTRAVGSDAALLIELDGTSAGAGVSGLTISSTGNTIRGLVINRFAAAGMRLIGAVATGSFIEGNYIGVDPTGALSRPNGGDGIELSQAGNNLIGGSTPAARNVIAGNDGHGILVVDFLTDIGSLAVADQLLAGAIPASTVSGSIPQADLNDVFDTFNGSWTFNHPVPGGGGDNYAFLATGTVVVASDGLYSFAFSSDDGGRVSIDGVEIIAVPNDRQFLTSYATIFLSAGQHSLDWVGYEHFTSAAFELSVAVGDNTAEVTAANGWRFLGAPDALADIQLQDDLDLTVFYPLAGVGGNAVVGNYLGVSAAGTAALGNTLDGVRVVNAAGVRIGTDGDGVADESEGNVIAANGRNGVFLSDQRLPVLTLDIADQLIDGTLPSGQATGKLPQADLVDQNDPALGAWAFDNPIPGGGGAGYAFRATGTLTVASAGVYSFALGSDDGGRVRVDGQTVAQFGATRAFGVNFGSVMLDAGVHTLEWVGFQAGGPGGFELSVALGVNTSEVTLANGWRVLGGPAVLPEIQLQGDLDLSVYYAVAPDSEAVIAGNLIGLDAAGGPLGNSQDGVQLFSANGVRIGTDGDGQSDVAEQNLIGNNSGRGVFIQDSVFNVVAGNVIDNNSRAGVRLEQALFLSGPAINGVRVETNEIAFNGAGGVVLVSAGASLGNAIRGNAIFANSGVGIDLNFDGPTANDPLDADVGVNNLQNFPELFSAEVANGVTTITGTLHSTPNTTFVLDFFRNGDPGEGSAEGETPVLPTAPATVTTDLNGDAFFSFEFAGNFAAEFFTATATRSAAAFDTSEFSPAIQVLEALSLVVNTTDDVVDNDGQTSLREAILLANALPGLDTITFAIPGSGLQTIALTSALPTITDAVLIDGYSQPGTAPNTLSAGNNAVLLIELNGLSAGAGVSGLTLGSAGSTIRGLIITRFAANGILVNGAQNTVAGNYIGVNALGTVILSNAGHGVAVVAAASNVIGGTTPGDANLIAGNFGAGVLVFGAAASNNVIQGNQIGTNAAGTTNFGNDNAGVRLDNAPNNTVGGVAVGARNLISGNNGDGVEIVGSGATGNLVQGNFIGTTALGTSNVGNGGAGVHLDNAPNNTVGGVTAAERNVISANNVHGVLLTGGGAAGNVVQGNFIGSDPSGTSGVGNAGSGIHIDGAVDNTIGGTAPGAGNRILANFRNGVTVVGGAAGNSVRGNSHGFNGLLGIDLGDDGVTANDPLDSDTGPNGFQNFPVLTSVVSSGGVTTVTGTLHSTPFTTFALDFYHSTSADPSGFGEGQNFVPFTTALTTTDFNGTAAFTFELSGDFAGQFLTATATPFVAPFNTSEFSRAVEAVGLTSPVVTTTADTVANDGATSLREALLFANANPGLDTIAFAIPGSGVQTITLASLLPVITDAVMIDGYTQPGASVNTLAVGSNAVLMIELSGNDTIFDGLVFRTSGSTLRGLVINRFFDDAVRLEGVQTGGNTIEGNFIGVDPTGTLALGNFDAVVIQNGTTNNLVGGATPAARNVLSGNKVGVTIAGAVGNVIAGNLIGTNAAGTAALGNGFFGVSLLLGASNTTVVGNVISGNNIGVGVFDGATQNNAIQGNRIGTDATGTQALGNDFAGVQLRFGTRGNLVGGDTPEARNIIAANGGDGVLVEQSSGNVVQGNFIGTDVSGTNALGNGFAGVSVSFGANNNAVLGNVLSGNGGDGLSFSFASEARVQGNFIGTDATGTLDLGNAQAGVLVGFGSDSIVIGADADNPDGGNVIAFNAKGVVVLDDGGEGSSSAITIPRNSIFANDGPGIDRGDDGFNASPDTPLLTEQAGNTIRGTLNGFGSYLIDFYATPLPSVPGQGKVYLGSVEVGANDFGTATFELTADIPAGHGVTATATQLESGDTSEFSAGPPRTLDLTGFPSPTPAGTPQSFLVRAVDDFGSTAIGYVGTVRFSSSEPRAVLVNLPGPFTFSPADNGVRAFTATFFRGGLKTLTVTDVAAPALTASQTDIAIASNLSASGVLILPVENVQFTGTVATFRDLSPADVNSYTAVIDWGDGTPTTPGTIVSTDDGFAVQGTHTFAREATFLVDVLISRPALFLAEVAESTAEVLTNRQAQRLIDFDADRCSPGDTTLNAESQGIDASLRDLPRDDDDCDVTLFVATFNGNPAPAPVNGTAFYDLRVLGTEAAGQLVVEFSYPPSGLDANVQLLFFDGTAYQPVAGSELRPLSLVNDPVRGVIRVVFDASSVPRLNDLRGTVFTVTVALPPSSGEVPTPITPSVAIAATSAALAPSLTQASRTIVTDTTERTPQPVVVNFRTSRTLNVTLSPDESGATDAPRTAARSGSAADDQDKEEALETMLRWLRSLWQQGWLRTLILPGMGQGRPASAPTPVVPASSLPEAEQPEALDAYFASEPPAPSEEEASDGFGLPLLFAAGVMGAAGQRSRRYTQKKSRRASTGRTS